MSTRDQYSSGVHRVSSWLLPFLIVLAMLLSGVAWAAAPPTVLLEDLSSQANPASKHQALRANELRVAGVRLDRGDVSIDASLLVHPIEVFAPDARITIQTPNGEMVQDAPGHVYLAGSIEGRPGSLAVLTLLDRGGVRGVLADGDSWWRIGEEPDKASGISGVVTRKIDTATKASFQCANADLPADLDSLLANMRDARPTERAGSRAVPTKGVAVFTARIAFETDQEYLALFGGNISDATDYIGDLTVLGSMVYTDEVATSWIVGSVNLWTATDPWDESPGSCALYEFGKYWNDNNSGVVRTIAHMLSGKNSNSGVAWVGVLCEQTFDSFPIVTSGCVEVPTSIDGADYGGNYGFTGGIDGNLDIGSPAPLWDSVAVLHEIGHNFNSPHTHCYNGLGGSASPIDMCFSGQSGCYVGATSLPSGCPGSGSNCGTIMSYCHLLAGGVTGNMSLSLGTDWPFGVLPGRVPTRMSAHVVEQDASFPGCLDFATSDTIFSDGFESGNTSAWDSTVN